MVPRLKSAPEVDLGLKPEDLRQLTRQIAAKVEERYRGSRPEAEGLVERVERRLATEVPVPREGDRNQQLVERMRLISITAGAQAELSGIRGYEFDASTVGRIQAYHDLEALQLADEAEVRRWIEMQDAAEHLKWQDKRQLCHERAVGAARAMVSREPKNATAHALLAAALDWEDDSGPETLAALRAAQKLEPKHPLATMQLLDRKVTKAFEAAAARKPTAMEDASPPDVNRLIYDRPFSEEEERDLNQELEQLEKETKQVMESAWERRDLTLWLTAGRTVLDLRYKAMAAAVSRQRPPHVAYEQFLGIMAGQQTAILFKLYENVEMVRRSIDLAGDNPEAIGTIMLLGLGGQMMHAKSQGQLPSAEQQALTREVTEKLVQMARGAETVSAARAAEAVCIIGMFEVFMGRKPEHTDMLARGLELDPCRHRMIGFLLAACMTLEKDTGRDAIASAIMEVQLAALPNSQTRRLCAAGAAKLHDWDSAFHLLDECAKETPGDLMLLSQRIVTVLRQSQSKAAVKKAASLYGGTNADSLIEKTASIEPSSRKEFIENFILFQVLKHDTETASQVLKQVVEAGILDEQTAESLKKEFR